MKSLKKQKQPYHYGPDAIEHFYINERIEERGRKEAHKEQRRSIENLPPPRRPSRPRNSYVRPEDVVIYFFCGPHLIPTETFHTTESFINIGWTLSKCRCKKTKLV